MRSGPVRSRSRDGVPAMIRVSCPDSSTAGQAKSVSPARLPTVDVARLNVAVDQRMRGRPVPSPGRCSTSPPGQRRALAAADLPATRPFGSSSHREGHLDHRGRSETMSSCSTATVSSLGEKAAAGRWGCRRGRPALRPRRGTYPRRRYLDSVPSANRSAWASASIASTSWVMELIGLGVCVAGVAGHGRPGPGWRSSREDARRRAGGPEPSDEVADRHILGRRPGASAADHHVFLFELVQALDAACGTRRALGRLRSPTRVANGRSDSWDSRRRRS